jgi:hypothetical protein
MNGKNLSSAAGIYLLVAEGYVRFNTVDQTFPSDLAARQRARL